MSNIQTLTHVSARPLSGRVSLFPGGTAVSGNSATNLVNLVSEKGIIKNMGLHLDAVDGATGSFFEVVIDGETIISIDLTNANDVTGFGTYLDGSDGTTSNGLYGNVLRSDTGTGDFIEFTWVCDLPFMYSAKIVLRNASANPITFRGGVNYVVEVR